MSTAPIIGFTPPDTHAAPQSARDSGGDNGNLFGDLLRSNMSDGAGGADQPPPSSASDRAPAPKPSDDDSSPTSDSSQAPESNGAADDTKAADSTAGDKTQTNSSKDSTNAAKADDKSGDAKDPKDAKGKKDEHVADGSGVVVAAAQTIPPVAAVVTAPAETAPSATEIKAAATTDAAAAAAFDSAAPKAPAVPATAAAPAPEAAPQETQAQTPGAAQSGAAQLQAQVTVTDDSKTLVSRPSAALAPAHAADLAEKAKTAGEGDKAKNAAAPALPGDKPSAATGDKQASGDKTDPANSPARPVNAAQLASDPATSGPKPDATPQQPLPQNAAPQPTMPVHSMPQTDTGAQIQAALTPQRPVAVAVPTAATYSDVAVQITKAAADGLDKISIQLKPESLGRIDVQLQVTHDGRVNATIAAQQQNTLDLLKRDSYSLQRALTDAGLQTNAGSLSFNLSGQGNGNAQSQSFAGTSSAPAVAAIDTAPLPSAATIAYNSAAARGGIDIRV